jgi:hypothetical protein
MSKITFEIDGIEYKIPTLITIGDYVKLYKVNGLFDDEYYQAKLINLITGAPLEKLMEVERDKVQFLSTKIIELIPTEKPGFVDKFTLDNVEYGFIPDWKKMSFGEFADLDTLMTKKPQEILDYVHIITAILYRPITKHKGKHNFEIEKYNQDTLTDRAELFKNKLDVEVALGAQFFFTLFARNSLNYTPTSLRSWMSVSWMQIKFAWKWRKILWRVIFKKDLDGSWYSTEFLKMTLRDIDKLQNKQS